MRARCLLFRCALLACAWPLQLVQGCSSCFPILGAAEFAAHVMQPSLARLVASLSTLLHALALSQGH